MSIGERIKSARILANKSQQFIADAADVSKMAISKYERDMDVPSSSVLIRLARALHVKIEYFFRPTTITLSVPNYRRKASLSDGQEASILEKVQEWLERYLDVEELLDMTIQCNLPDKQTVSTFDEIESVACSLRDFWNLGLDPIENLMEVCEENGIKVGLIDADDSFDALTLWANNTIPIIVIRRDMPGDRQRFCLAHELGHLVLQPTGGLDEEKAAHRFAGALLVPRSAVKRELGLRYHAINRYELHLLKYKYGLSMQAWIYRAKDVGILPETVAMQMFKQFRQYGWYREEPGDAVPSEAPQRFQRLVIHALCEGIISQARAADLLGTSVSQFLSREEE